MESLVLSYCFFEPKSLHKEMRTWDLYNNQDRYWYNIPALMAVNSIIYPNAKIKIHYSKSVSDNPLFEILEKISNVFPNIELVSINYDYQNTEPTMWRYKPVFDKEAEVVFCRDIDSLPTSDEIRASYYFLKNSGYFVHTLRTHTNHVIPHTIILAGLCGFRPSKIDFISNISFEVYYNHFKNSSWGLDQSSLINLFVHNQNWTDIRFLDSPISTSYHRVGNPLIRCVSKDQDFYKKEVELDIDKKLIEFIDRVTTWSGEPIDVRGGRLKELLDIDLPEVRKIRTILDECNEEIKRFYLGNV